MKKTFVAAAVLGALAGSAFAADVTLYGVVDTGLMYQRTDSDKSGESAVNKLSMESGLNAGSRFGLKGTEDLGNGYSVGFVLENGFDSDAGTLGKYSEQRNRLFGREATLNLNTPFGTLGMGRMGNLNSGNGSTLTGLLKEKGDEIFADCDAIALELDLEKETVKQVLHYAKKYHKKVFAAISNMSIAMERRDFLQQIDCFVCNQQEAGLLFSDDYDHLSPEEMRKVLAANVHSANIPSMVITMGGQGAVYARANGGSGIVPAKKVDVLDTTGAGDAFFAGTVIGQTYGKTLAESCEIGSRLAASVICITENVCPRFRPLEFGLDVPVVD